MTHSLPPPAPNLSLSYNQQGFQPVPWFYATFGTLPRLEIYQLASTEARQAVLNALAATLGHTEPITEPTSRAELYNREPNTFTELESSGKRIGFSR